MKAFKEIVVVSGKGGTGKTTLTAALATALPDKVIADTDVDAANLHLLMRPQNSIATDFRGKDIAEIDPAGCAGCGLCREKCRFDAIVNHGQHYQVDESACEGCTLCSLLCPSGAIAMKQRIVGRWMASDTSHGPMIHARLKAGGENSGHLVTMVRLQAKHRALEDKCKFIIIDGPPGIGCPVNAALTGTDFAVIVTEPTQSGISDLKRLIRLIQNFDIPFGIVINRYDVHMENSAAIETFCRELDSPLLGKIPHSYKIIDAIAAAHIPLRECEELDRTVLRIKETIENL